MSSIVTKGVRARFESVLNKVLSAWTLKEDGGLTSSEWGITFYEDALSQLLIRDGSGLSEVEFKSCVTGAARDLVKAGQSGSDAFNEAYSKRRDETLALECRRSFGLTRCAFQASAGTRAAGPLRANRWARVFRARWPKS